MMNSVCSVMTVPAAADDGQDTIQLSFPEREDFLLAWTLKNCAGNSVVGLEEGWDLLNRYGIEVIHRFLNRKTSNGESKKPIGSKGFASLYTISYKLSTVSRINLIDHARDLYDRCKQSVEDFVQTNIVQKLHQMLLEEGIDFLREYADSWSKHKTLTNWMWRLCKNLDKTVVRTEDLPPLTACYMTCFYEQVFLQFNAHTRICILQCYAKDREGNFCPASRRILQEVIEVRDAT